MMDYVPHQSNPHVNWKASAIESCCTSSSSEDIKENVRKTYGGVAEANEKGQSCGITNSCCGAPAEVDVNYALQLGYSEEDVASVCSTANMGLGCGNPQKIAGLKAGEFVLDLGAGGGFDVFLAARKVGPTGKAIGVDMTPEMIRKARLNAEKSKITNVEFRLGEIEHLPIPNSSIDVIISNCVINLSTDKRQVFNEAFRVLKNGGRLAISDIVATQPMPDSIKNDLRLHSACIAGAMGIDEVKESLQAAGFKDIKIMPKKESRIFIKNWAPDKGVENYVVSAEITARK